MASGAWWRTAEHLKLDADGSHAAPAFGTGMQDAKLRVVLPRPKWAAIADEVRVEFNRRLKKQGHPASRWKRGANPLARLLGKELTLLAWAIEDADPALIHTAVKNWLGLVPEECWWLFIMANAAIGHALHGRDKGWRKAVRFALTENPVVGRGERDGGDIPAGGGEARASIERGLGVNFEAAGAFRLLQQWEGTSSAERASASDGRLADSFTSALYRSGVPPMPDSPRAMLQARHRYASGALCFAYLCAMAVRWTSS